jgi:hypothetical protein
MSIIIHRFTEGRCACGADDTATASATLNAADVTCPACQKAQVTIPSPSEDPRIERTMDVLRAIQGLTPYDGIMVLFAALAWIRNTHLHVGSATLHGWLDRSISCGKAPSERGGDA